MGLIAKIKTIWKFRKSFAEIKEKFMTKGMRSSEFWLTVLAQATTVFQAVQGQIDPKTATIISAVLTAVYTIARTMVKKAEGEAA